MSCRQPENGVPDEVAVWEWRPATALGESALVVDRPDDQQIINYEEAEAIRGTLVRLVSPYIEEVTWPPPYRREELRQAVIMSLPDDLGGIVGEHITAGVRRIADGSMRGRALSIFNVVTSFLNADWYDGDTMKIDTKGKDTIVEGGMLLTSTLSAAAYLTRAVALLEGCMPPNKPIDYVDAQDPDIEGDPMRAYQIDQMARVNLENAYSFIKSSLWLGPDARSVSAFGDVFTTLDIVDAIARRAEVNRPASIGSPFPRLVAADVVALDRTGQTMSRLSHYLR